MKGKLLGGLLAIVGGAIMLIAGFMTIITIPSIEANLDIAGLTWADVGIEPFIFYLRSILTFLWALLGIIGGIILIVGKNIGGFLALIGGILGIAGNFIIVGTLTIYESIPIPLSTSFLLIDPILIALGGLLGLIMKK
ncbi:MAG: hypothetical protein MUP85_16755 [Candidatus Lokiarchaeota archaeon]|nr:hypothetical protein [Candidatus Lokiarchaeota archaeon]